MTTRRKAPKTSRRASPKARDSGGMIEWEHLTAKEQLQFKRAFVTKRAMLARLEALGWSKSGFEPQFAWALHEYETARWRRRAKAKIPEAIELNASLHKLEINLAHGIRDAICHAMTIGNWQCLRWLADYGETHCPQGLGQLLPSEQELPAACFPEPHTQAVATTRNNFLLGTEMLRSFVMLTGCDMDLLTAPGRDADNEPGSPMIQDIYIPKKLPTKQHLREVTLKANKRLTDSDPKDPSSHISRLMRSLGFSGLPKGSPQPLSEATLSEEGRELRDQMRGA